MKALNIAFVSLARPTFDLPLAEKVTESVRQGLVDSGYHVSGSEGMVMDLAAAQRAAEALAGEAIDLLLILQATFADSTMISALAEATKAPLLLWAVPEKPTGGRLRLNSLCGINLAGHALNLRGRNYAYAYAHPDDEAVYGQIRDLTLAGRAARTLQAACIGLVGEHPEGMDTCRFDAAALDDLFGVRISPIGLTGLFEQMDEIPAADLEKLRIKIEPSLPNLNEMDTAALNGTLSAYAVLDGMARDHEIDGYAIRCWPEIFEQKNCAACGAMSLLNDSAIPSSCEADVNGTVTQLILQAISDDPTFDCDVVSVDPEQDHVIIWHCGKAPFSMADPTVQIEAGLHSNRKVPLVMEFPLKPGRITAARLSQANGQLTLVVGAGEMLAAPKSFSGTSGVVRFDRPAGEVLDTILDSGLEHHLAITYGDYVPALIAFAKIFDLPILNLS